MTYAEQSRCQRHLYLLELTRHHGHQNIEDSRSSQRKEFWVPGAKKPRYSKEFKKEAVQLLRSSDRSIPQLANELGVSEGSLRNWLKQADIDEGITEGLTTQERQELTRLRREVKILQQEREILKKAAAFFARENGIR
jgi:transposase